MKTRDVEKVEVVEKVSVDFKDVKKTIKKQNAQYNPDCIYL